VANLYLEHAREALGVGEDWVMMSWTSLDVKKYEVDDPRRRLKVTGCVAPRLDDGRVAWEYEVPGTRKSVTWTGGEHDAWVLAWEHRTGKCSSCSPAHPGQEYMGWTAAEGILLRKCQRCNGTNQAPGVDHA